MGLAGRKTDHAFTWTQETAFRSYGPRKTLIDAAIEVIERPVPANSAVSPSGDPHDPGAAMLQIAIRPQQQRDAFQSTNRATRLWQPVRLTRNELSSCR